MWKILQWLLPLRRAVPVAANQASGDEGERLAADFLARERGCRIVARNWRNPRDEREEIDLVCLDGDILVFVEVKARSVFAFVPGYYAVNGRKKKVLRRACLAYLRGLRKRPATIRFDVVEITHGGPDGPRVLHFEHVPLFAKHDRP